MSFAVVIPAHREFFFKTGKDSGQAGMTRLKSNVTIMFSCISSLSVIPVPKNIGVERESRALLISEKSFTKG
jgi:hypothetical protein